MNKNIITLKALIKINTKRFFRDRLALFFTVIFPLIFLFIFGAMSKNDSVSFNIALINNGTSEFAQSYDKQVRDSDLFKVDDSVTNLDAAKEKMTRGEVDAAIVLPTDFGDNIEGQVSGEATVVYTSNNQQSAQTLLSVVQSQFNVINSNIVVMNEPFTVVGQELNDRALSSFDYTFSGLLGFSIIGLGIFGPVNVFPELKKQGILRRLHTTPLKVWQYFISNMISQAIIGIMTLSVSFIVGIVVFNLNVVGNWFELIAFIALGIINIYGIGLAIGGWAKNERQAAPLSNIVVFPMMFLSGTFFPRFLMPEWLQSISSYLPLTPVIDGIRLIATEGKHLSDIGPQLALILVWTIVIYTIAFRVFRWE